VTTALRTQPGTARYVGLDATQMVSVAGVIAVPAGIVLHHHVLPAMAAAANVALPGTYLHVYTGAEMVALALAGLGIAVAGALLPAGWAAKTGTAAALRTE
jgi:putative ABC transport system permease protein